MKTRTIIIVTVLTAALGIFIIWLLFRPGECCEKCKCRGNALPVATGKERGNARPDPMPPRAAPRREPPARRAAPLPAPRPTPMPAPVPAPPPVLAKAPTPAKPKAPPAKSDCVNCEGQTYEELGITNTRKDE